MPSFPSSLEEFFERCEASVMKIAGRDADLADMSRALVSRTLKHYGGPEAALELIEDAAASGIKGKDFAILYTNICRADVPTLRCVFKALEFNLLPREDLLSTIANKKMDATYPPTFHVEDLIEPVRQKLQEQVARAKAEREVQGLTGNVLPNPGLKH